VGLSPAFREGTLDIVNALLVAAGCLLVQIAANLIDEYSDHARPEGREKILAPYKVIALGVLTADAVKKGAVVCVVFAAVIGAYLVWISGWPILWICLLSMVVVYFYSAGPRPLGSIGLGQPLVFLFMGPIIVLGTYYVQTRAFSQDVFFLSLPIACTVTAILAANDIRDIEEDRIAGKITPGTAFGRRFAQGEFLLLLVLAFTLVIALVIGKRTPPFSLLSLLAIPQAIKAWRLIWRGRNRQERALGLRATSKLHWYFGVLLALGAAGLF
jgi:1,4-dihydroxy-2-naphthoate octaprenyltransferase